MTGGDGGHRTLCFIGDMQLGTWKMQVYLRMHTDWNAGDVDYKGVPLISLKTLSGELGCTYK